MALIICGLVGRRSFPFIQYLQFPVVVVPVVASSIYIVPTTTQQLPTIIMSIEPLHTYRYTDLPTDTSIRVLELLPGNESDPISCLLHIIDGQDAREYEAVSYAWGDPNVKVPINCDGKRLEITLNLHAALIHIRFEDRARFLWADAIW
jgi:hypothetical protein